MNPTLDRAALVQLLTFLSTHREALENAARLLGGPVAVRRLRTLLDTLSVPEPRVTRWVARELLALHRLLTLEAAKSEASAAQYLSRVDPDDPAVEEICLLGDELKGVLKGLISDDEADRAALHVGV